LSGCTAGERKSAEGKGVLHCEYDQA
jgi:hypothetical protein